MKRVAILALLPAFLIGCAPAEEGGEEVAAAAAAGPGIQLDVTPPEPLPIPEAKEVSGDDDWAAKAHNEERSRSCRS